jgi:uncharacterized protein (DUF433 family)
MNWRTQITVDPLICHGKACIAGTRIPVAVILANLAGGESIDSVCRSYPVLTRDAVYASLDYAAELVEERVISLPD